MDRVRFRVWGAFFRGEFFLEPWSGMGNVKCENAWHVQDNVTTADFASNLTANICFLLAT